MGSKHTPGPWFHEPTGDGLERLITGWPSENTCTVVGVVDGNKTSQETTEANARLIAAAPELLEALEALGDWLAHGLAKPEGAKPTAADMQRCEELGRQARAAVDKAKGEPHA